ncbi:MAG: hypothetical protein IJ562_04245 [Prevotella sp.]|nr:hypothetical protein [Prevotella sp.]
MMEADNTFSGIFGKKPSTEQNTNPQNSQEYASAIKEQSEVVPQAVSEQQPMQEEREPDTAEKSVRKRGRRRKGDDSTEGATADKAVHFSCICNKDLIAKVRAIAWQEHLTVRSVVESMFSKCIAKYEKKRGPIQIVPNQPSEELF